MESRLPGDPVVLEVGGEHVHLGVQRDNLGPEGLVLTQYLLKILLQVVTPTVRLKNILSVCLLNAYHVRHTPTPYQCSKVIVNNLL